MIELEVLKAKQGDCLLLRYADEGAEPCLMLIDGGPSGVYKQFLAPRLSELQELRNRSEPLPLEVIVVSHMDHDHIDGILDLLREIGEASDDNRSPLVDVKQLWHNSFADVIASDQQAVEVETSAVKIASTGDDGSDFPLSLETKVVLSSVKEGRQLRDAARAQHIVLNSPFGGGVVQHQSAPVSHRNLTIRFLCPQQHEINRLRAEWDKQVAKMLTGERQARVAAAEMLDNSVFNLASIVMIVEADERSLLFTGDARGDLVIEAVQQQNLLRDGTLHVDLLKVPHHGSDRNVDVNFFKTITADHYVISGNGRHHNPSVKMFSMLFEARPDPQDRPYTIHLTYAPSEWKSGYPLQEYEELMASARANQIPFTVNTIEPGQSIVW